jgi:uncharacterized protein
MTTPVSTTTIPPTLPATVVTPSKGTSSFWNAFTNKIETTAETDAKVVITDVETEGSKLLSLAEYTLEYSADKAVSNVKGEVTKLQTLVNGKLSSIASHNEQILSHQGAVKSLEDDVAKAKALAEKLVASIS